MLEFNGRSEMDKKIVSLGRGKGLTAVVFSLTEEGQLQFIEIIYQWGWFIIYLSHCPNCLYRYISPIFVWE